MEIFENNSDNQKKKLCEFCSRENFIQNLFKCSRCQSVWYCDQKCQKDDWIKHKKQCEGPPRDPPLPYTIDHFKDLVEIGEGNFSKIFRAKCKYSKKLYAIKQINKYNLNKLNKNADIEMEKYCLQKLEQNPQQYIIKLHSYFEDELNKYLLMEFVEGKELWHQIQVFGIVSYPLIKYYLGQIINALEYIHSLGIVHRDLKPENIMLTNDKKVKLVDFGTARDMLNPLIKSSGNGKKGRKIFDHFVGTAQYMAPESIHNWDSSYQTDIWALGCICYQLVTGFTPFLGGSDYLIFQKSLNDPIQFQKGLFRDGIDDLINKMMKKDAKERISINEIKSHPFFHGFDFDNITKYEDYSIYTRGEQFIEKVKTHFIQNRVQSLQDLEQLIQHFDSRIITLLPEETDRQRARILLPQLQRQLEHHFEFKKFEFQEIQEEDHPIEHQQQQNQTQSDSSSQNSSSHNSSLGEINQLEIKEEDEDDENQ